MIKSVSSCRFGVECGFCDTFVFTIWDGMCLIPSFSHRSRICSRFFGRWRNKSWHTVQPLLPPRKRLPFQGGGWGSFSKATKTTGVNHPVVGYSG
eukprot:s1352_g18.t1